MSSSFPPMAHLARPLHVIVCSPPLSQGLGQGEKGLSGSQKTRPLRFESLSCVSLGRWFPLSGPGYHPCQNRGPGKVPGLLPWKWYTSLCPHSGGFMKGSLMQNPGQRLEKGRLRSSPVASRSPRTVGLVGEGRAGVHLGGGHMGPQPCHTTPQSEREGSDQAGPHPSLPPGWGPEPGRTWVKNSLSCGPTLPGFTSLLCLLKAGGP